LTCECERSTEPTLGQAFQLVSGPTINDLLTREGNRLSGLISSGKSPVEIVEELFLWSLARFPTADESRSIVAYLEQAADRRASLEDAAWSLLNSKEFLLRH
jgi:hypothetical protein